MRLLVTGAAGMLGRAVVAAAEGAAHDVTALTRRDLDITDPDAVRAAVADARPDAVINCAAWTDVDGAEDAEAAAMRVNDAGAALLAAAAAASGAKVLYVSTDYVFDGTKQRPYVESDLPAPISAYGRSKQAGETSVAVANPRNFVVRSSWLFGTGGRNFVETMLRLGSEQPEVLVVSDQRGCPTYTRHLAEGIALLVEGDDFGIHHMAGAGSCSWFEFAQEIFDEAGLEARVMAATTDMLTRKAPRPANSVLSSERPDPIVLPHWKQGLGEYMAAREARAAGGVK
jgi:dTDP-4-dehydrorhamnose reductase